MHERLTAKLPYRGRLLALLLAGALLPLAFAPFGFWPLAILCPALFLFLIHRQSRRRAALLGLVFGLGYFGFGTSWVYVSIHDFGFVPVLPSVLLTLLLVGGLILQFHRLQREKLLAADVAQHSTTLNQMLYDAVEDSVLVTSEAGDVISCNGAFAALCGVELRRLELAQMNQVRKWLAQRIQESDAIWDKLESGASVRITTHTRSEYLLRCAIRPLPGTGTVRIWTGHRVRGTSVENDDVIEHMVAQRTAQLEEKLASANQLIAGQRQELNKVEEIVERLQSVLENVADGMLIIGPSGTIQFANHEAKRIIGLRELDPDQVPIEELLEGYLGWATLVFSQDASGAGSRQQQWQEFVLRRPNGESVNVEVTVKRLTFFSEELQVAIVRDLERRRDAEKELIAAREAALLASRLKSEFIANMTHEIRTPLNGVLGMLSLIRGTQLNGEQREYAEIAVSSGEALLQLLNDILDFAKIEAGHLVLYADRFDLLELLDDVIGLFASSANERNLDFGYFCAPEIPRHWSGDMARLRQVLVNLIGNAVKFTAAGSVSLGVSQWQQGLRFEVTDTGVGIDQSRADEVFEVFTQIDGSMSRRYGGAGLGLAISKKLVGIMEGEIGVDSALGRGSRFWFTARLHPEAEVVQQDVVVGETQVCLIGAGEVVSANVATLCREFGVELTQYPGIAQVPRDTVQQIGRGGVGWVIVDGQANLRELEKMFPKQDRKFNLVALVQPGGARTSRADREGLDATLMRPVRFSAMRQMLLRRVEDHEFQTDLRFPLDHPPQVLLVEDDTVNQQVTTRLLERLGLQVHLVSDGQQAVDRALTEQFDLILLDCQLPVMDGFQAARRIRELERGGRVPIVALTARAMEDDRQQCLDAGMDDHLAKPVTLGSLEEKVRLWLCGEAGPASEIPASRLTAERNEFATSLRSLSELMGDGLDALMDAYLADTTARLQQMREAAAVDDTAELSQLAHTVKGSSLNVGAAQFAQLCSDLDLSCRDGLPADVDNRLDQLDTAFTEVREVIQEFLRMQADHV